MVIAAILALVLGAAAAQWLFTPEISELFFDIADYSLYLLMLSVGISVGMNKLILRKLREYNLTILLIPFGITVGSILGGAVCAMILKMPWNTSVAISSGMGWYSLSGVLLTDLAGAEAGAIAFLSNLLREIFSFLLIPLIVKYCNPYTAIAPAGATSEDTTLPMMIRYTGEDVVVISVLNGILCSALVPILIPFFYAVL